ncbi:hypothetical protein DPMN_173586 [Dreissena polymorpha]|uniref:Uncharacterized protein n=1 Tax=Dreissena polymorpha TaxID=45954 RepID=A0A9D4IHR1_DREPO|nr:hypothetical protein DPMN_173586 [Dreissena polymorpha]
MEAVSDRATLDRLVLAPFTPPRAGLWFPPLDGCVCDRDHCEPLRRPSFLPLPLPSGSSGLSTRLQGHSRARAVQSPDVPNIEHRPAKISYCTVD